MPTSVTSHCQCLIPAKSLAQAHNIVVSVEMEDMFLGSELLDFSCKREWKWRTGSLCHPAPACSVHVAALGGVTGQHPRISLAE